MLQQHGDGSMLGSAQPEATTITCSRGVSLDVETTSVAVLAWLHDGDLAMPVRKAMDWLVCL